MIVRRPGPERPQRGITGLETAIILIAFVIVAAVLAFTILSTGVFATGRSKETVLAGLTSVKSSLKPSGSLIAFRGKVGAANAVFKFSIIVESPTDGESIDLTPPVTADGTGTDPDTTSNVYTTVLSYTDENQALSDVPWSANIFGEDTDNSLDPGEKAEIVVWLLNRATSVAQDASNSASYMSSGGITSSGTLVNENDTFTLTLTPAVGPTITWTRTLPSALDSVMSLK